MYKAGLADKLADHDRSVSCFLSLGMDAPQILKILGRCQRDNSAHRTLRSVCATLVLTDLYHLPLRPRPQSVASPSVHCRSSWRWIQYRFQYRSCTWAAVVDSGTGKAAFKSISMTMFDSASRLLASRWLCSRFPWASGLQGACCCHLSSRILPVLITFTCCLILPDVRHDTVQSTAHITQ